MSEENPVLKPVTSDSLLALKQRAVCHKCSHSRGFYCHVCCIPMPFLKDLLPKLEFPVKVDILRHAYEINGKNTASHAAILAPNDVNIHEYPAVPDYKHCSAECVVVLFPCETAVPITHLAECEQSGRPIRLVILDATWRDVKYMAEHPNLKGLQRIQLPQRQTQFWRADFKKRPAHYLATIEALYYFLVDFCQLVQHKPYVGQYDGLMLFFDYFLKRVENRSFSFVNPGES